MRLYLSNKSFEGGGVDWFSTLMIYGFIIFFSIIIYFGPILEIVAHPARIECRRQGMDSMRLPWSSKITCVPHLTFPVEIK